MCAVLISVIFCSPAADGWPGSNWRFLSNPFLIVPNAPIITGKIFVFTFLILLISISRSLYLLVFQFVVRLYQSVGKFFSFLSWSTISSQFDSVVLSVITGTSHIIVVQQTFPYVHSTCQQPVNPFKCHPVDVTSHLTASISIFRWCKCCASCNNMFYVFCLTGNPAFTINWVLHDVPPMIMHSERLLFGCYY